MSIRISEKEINKIILEETTKVLEKKRITEGGFGSLVRGGEWIADILKRWFGKESGSGLGKLSDAPPTKAGDAADVARRAAGDDEGLEAAAQRAAGDAAPEAPTPSPRPRMGGAGPVVGRAFLAVLKLIWFPFGIFMGSLSRIALLLMVAFSRDIYELGMWGMGWGTDDSPCAFNGEGSGGPTHKRLVLTYKIKYEQLQSEYLQYIIVPPGGWGMSDLIADFFTFGLASWLRRWSGEEGEDVDFVGWMSSFLPTSGSVISGDIRQNRRDMMRKIHAIVLKYAPQEARKAGRTFPSEGFKKELTDSIVPVVKGEFQRAKAEYKFIQFPQEESGAIAGIVESISQMVLATEELFTRGYSIGDENHEHCAVNVSGEAGPRRVPPAARRDMEEKRRKADEVEKEQNSNRIEVTRKKIEKIHAGYNLSSTDAKPWFDWAHQAGEKGYGTEQITEVIDKWLKLASRKITENKKLFEQFVLITPEKGNLTYDGFKKWVENTLVSNKISPDDHLSSYLLNIPFLDNMLESKITEINVKPLLKKMTGVEEEIGKLEAVDSRSRKQNSKLEKLQNKADRLQKTYDRKVGKRFVRKAITRVPVKDISPDLEADVVKSKETKKSSRKAKQAVRKAKRAEKAQSRKSRKAARQS